MEYVFRAAIPRESKALRNSSNSVVLSIGKQQKANRSARTCDILVWNGDVRPGVMMYAYKLACRRGFNRIQNCLAHGQQNSQISISKKRGILGY